jgi:protein SCO1/2
MANCESITLGLTRPGAHWARKGQRDRQRDPGPKNRFLAWPLALALAAAGGACGHKSTAKRYPLQGQVLSVDVGRQEITISHGDVPGLMPAMTMAYPVASAKLLDGRTAGELVAATLEVDDAMGRIVEIAHTGSAPLPPANQIAMASGVLGIGDAVPDAAFIDQANRRRAMSEWKGTLTVLTFTYTRCPLPNFCPLMDQNFATLQRRLADDTMLRGHVKLVTVSFDPDHDTPDVLAGHARKLHVDPAVWTLLTGDHATVDRFTGTFGVGVMRDSANTTELVHNLRTVLIGADGRIAKIYVGNEWTPGTVLTDLRRLVGTGK